MQKPSLWTNDFVKICFSSFFLFMTFYTLATTLPIYVAGELHGNQQQIGLVMTVFIIAAVLLRPLAGQWIDRYSKKKIIVWSLALFFIATVAYLGIQSLFLLLALRFIHGGAFGAGSTATGAAAVDLIPEQRKGEGIGYFSLFMSLAMVIGPFVGLTVTSHFSFPVLIAICCVFSLLSFLCGTTAHLSQAPQAPKPNARKSFQWTSYFEPKAVPIALAGFVLAFAYSSLITFISTYAKELSLESAASYFFVFFAVMIVLPRPFVGKIFDKHGENVLVYPGIAIFIIGMAALSQAHTAALFLASGAVIGLGYGVLLPCFQTLAVQASPSHRRGLATSTYFLLFDLGYGLGSYFLGVVASRTHYHTMYLFATVIVAFTAPIYFVLHHSKKAKTAHQALPE